VRNRARVIGACLNSILASDYPPEKLEIVVTDNDSTDDTAAVLRGYGDRIRLVWERKRGPGAARNAALAAAGGEVVAFTDSDCLVDRAWVARIIQPLRDGEYGAAGGRILALPAGNDVEHFGERIHDHALAILYYRPAYLITMNLAVRLDVLRNVGCFDERLLRYEDVDLSYRLQQAGHAFAYVPDAYVYHRNRSNVVALMREAWGHGYYAPKLHRLHAEYRNRNAGSTGPEPPPHARTPFTRDLAESKTKLYWLLFRSAKRAGRLFGSLRASKLYHHV
jgi:glycosyltransferase involved in cell wall biosynthesis